ncbi:lipopolysaccharide biosynthesis protein, partial [Thomasclavelia cocleata]
NTVSWYINQLSDRWIISIFLGAGPNGIYALANKIPSIVNILYPAFNLAWTDSATRSVNDPDSAKYYNHMFKMLFCIVSAGTVLLLAASPIIFEILCRNKSLASAFDYTPTLIIATYFYCFSQFFGSIYVAVKSAKNMSITTTMAAVVNISINLFLIKIIGVQAAVISTLVANLFLAGYRFFDLNKNYYRLRINKRLTILTVIVITIISLLAWSNDPILWGLDVVLAIGYAYFISGDIFVGMIKSFLKKG